MIFSTCKKGKSNTTNDEEEYYEYDEEESMWKHINLIKCIWMYSTNLFIFVII